MIRMIGAMVRASKRADQLVARLEAGLVHARSRAERLPKRPRVFFEEWDDPLISGIGWRAVVDQAIRKVDLWTARHMISRSIRSSTPTDPRISRQQLGC
jgi:hypothetical protein